MEQTFSGLPYRKVGVFIAGRLQSERLPNKLILPFGKNNEQCLWDIACAKLNKLPGTINRYALCYEDELIEIASKYKNIEIIKRDPETINVDGPLKFIFKDLSKVTDTHLMFLNPCLPFLSRQTIVDAVINFTNSIHFEYATSVKPYKNWLFKCDNGLTNVTNIDYERLSTKEIQDYYEAAHCFHIFNRIGFFMDGMMLKSGHCGIAVPLNETIDVDTESDFEFMVWKWNKLNGGQNE